MPRRFAFLTALRLAAFVLSAPTTLHCEPSLPNADESSIVPLSYKVASVVLETQVSPTSAAVRFTRDGVNYAESGERSAYPFIHPLQGREFAVCRGFGMVKDEARGKEYFHPGVDFAASEGTPVVAAASGKIERYGYTAGYGIYIVINHGSFSSLYGHLRKDRLVKKGDTVAAGARIGSVGSTGDTDGSLLHYEIRLSKSKSGVLHAVDPNDFLDIAKRAGSKGSAASMAFGVDALIPRFAFKGGIVAIDFDLPEGNVAIRGAPSELPLRNPLGKGAYKMDTGFGLRTNPFSKKKEFHTGLDIASYWGAPIYATGSGTVAKIGHDSGYGNYAIIRHGRLVSLYSHLKDLSALSEGMKVSAGTRIGVVGNTGMTTGPHVHYEIRLVDDHDSDFKESVKRLFDPQLFLDWAARLGIR